MCPTFPDPTYSRPSDVRAGGADPGHRLRERIDERQADAHRPGAHHACRSRSRKCGGRSSGSSGAGLPASSPYTTDFSSPSTASPFVAAAAAVAAGRAPSYPGYFPGVAGLGNGEFIYSKKTCQFRDQFRCALKQNLYLIFNELLKVKTKYWTG